MCVILLQSTKFVVLYEIILLTNVRWNMSKEMDWTLYIIETENGKLYTGITTDLERRFWEHCSGFGAKYFRSETPHQIVYTEMHIDRSEASKREYEIKKMSKEKKLELISCNYL